MLQQQGSVAAVVPHILGVLCAHFHHFFAVVWPRIMLEENGGQAIAAAKLQRAVAASIEACDALEWIAASRPSISGPWFSGRSPAWWSR